MRGKFTIPDVLLLLVLLVAIALLLGVFDKSTPDFSSDELVKIQGLIRIITIKHQGSVEEPSGTRKFVYDNYVFFSNDEDEVWYVTKNDELVIIFAISGGDLVTFVEPEMLDELNKLITKLLSELPETPEDKISPPATGDFYY